MKTMAMFVVLMAMTLPRASSGAGALRESSLLRLLPAENTSWAAIVDLESCQNRELMMMPIAFSFLLRDIPGDVLAGMTEILLVKGQDRHTPDIFFTRPKPNDEARLWKDLDVDGESRRLPADIDGTTEIEVKQHWSGTMILRISRDLWAWTMKGTAEDIVANLEKQLAQKETLPGATPAIRSLLDDTPTDSLALVLVPNLPTRAGVHSAGDFLAGLAWPAEALVMHVQPGPGPKEIVVVARARFPNATDAQVTADGVAALQPLGRWLERSLNELARKDESLQKGSQPIRGFINLLGQVTARLEDTTLSCKLPMNLAQEPVASLFKNIADVNRGNQDIVCVSNLKQIGLALAMYENDYKKFPDTFEPLNPYLSDKRVYRCRASRLNGQKNTTYLYLIPPDTTLADIKEPSRTMTVIDDPDGTTHQRLAVLFADGHVQQVDPAGLKTPAEIAAKYQFILLPKK